MLTMEARGKVLFVNAHPTGYPFAEMIPHTFGTHSVSDHLWDVTLINSYPKDSGFSLVQREDRSKLRLPDYFSDYCCIVITGSSYSARHRTRKDGVAYLSKWKVELIDFIREAGKQQVPIFGVCFGAQMLAEALGGLVLKGSQTEMGYARIAKTQAGIDNKLLCDVPEIFAAPENHAEWIVRLPEGSELLAVSDGGIQAFQSGIHFGVEFHPERSIANVEQTLADAKASDSKRFARSGLSFADNLELQNLYVPGITNMFNTFLQYALNG